MNDRIRVLNLCEDCAQRRALTGLFKAAGATVIGLESPAQAVGWLEKSEAADLIVVGLEADHSSTWQVLRQLRETRIPLLGVCSDVVAGSGSAETMRRYLGLHQVLPWPCPGDRVKEAAAELIAHPLAAFGPRVLLRGFAPDGPEVECFVRAGYEVVTGGGGVESDLDVVVSADCEAGAATFRGKLLNLCPGLGTTPWPAELCQLAGNQPSEWLRQCERERERACLALRVELLQQRLTAQSLAQEQYLALMDCLPDLVLSLSEGGQILQANHSGCNWLGASPSEVEGMSLLTLVPATAHDQVRAGLRETLLFGESRYETTLSFKRLQSPVQVHQRKVVSGNQSRLVAVLRDISERHHFEQAVMATDTRYRVIAENTYDWEFWLSPQGYFLFCSPSAEKLTGYANYEHEDNPGLLSQLVVPEDREDFLRNWRLEGPDDLPKQFEFRIRRRDGEVRWISHVSTAVYDSRDHFLGSRGSHRDITEKRQADVERDRLVGALEQASEAILITDGQGRVHFRNQACRQRLTPRWQGHSSAELPGDDSWNSAHRQILDAMNRGQSWTGEYIRYSADKLSRYEVVSTVTPVLDRLGQVSCYVWVERDVTEERMLAEQLRQSQKMEAVGTLAGGIAHDFNNLLTGILGFSGLLRVQANSVQDVLHSAEVIERTARKAAELTQQLLGFARRGKHQHAPVCIHKAIHESIKLLGRALDKRIELSTRFEAAHSVVMGDPVQIEQVLLNLAINARDAIAAQGVITFSTSREEINSTPYLAIAVSDTGGGIPEEIRDRIFEPFFTTKENGKGTGMGLAMVYGIIKNHGGLMRVESQVGRGTTFTLYLPAAAEAAPARQSKSPRPSKGSGTILVVDDEELVREVACKLLGHLGYQTRTACDGADAEAYYAQHHAEIDLVIIDMIMPKVAGPECYRRLCAIKPDVRAILSTGYCLNETAQQMLDAGVNGFIQKPYQLLQLSECIRTALGRETCAKG